MAATRSPLFARPPDQAAAPAPSSAPPVKKPPVKAKAKPVKDETKPGQTQAARGQAASSPKPAPAGKANATTGTRPNPPTRGQTTGALKPAPPGKAKATTGTRPTPPVGGQTASAPKLAPPAHTNAPGGAGKEQSVDALLSNPLAAAGATVADAIMKSVAAAVPFVGQGGESTDQAVEQFAQSAPLQNVRAEIARAGERSSASSRPADNRTLPILEAFLRMREAESPSDWAKDRAIEIRNGDPAHTGSNLAGLAVSLYSHGASLGALHELYSELWQEATGDHRVFARAMYEPLNVEITHVEGTVVKDWTEHAQAIRYDSLMAERTEFANRLLNGGMYFDAYDDKLRLFIDDAEIARRISEGTDRWAEHTPLEQQALKVQLLVAYATQTPSMEAGLTAVAAQRAYENSIQAVSNQMASKMTDNQLSEQIQRLNVQAPSDPTGVASDAAHALKGILHGRVYELEGDVRKLSVNQIESLADELDGEVADKTPLEQATLDLYRSVLSDLKTMVWDPQGREMTKARMLHDQYIAGNNDALDALEGNIVSALVMWATDDPRWAAIAGGAFDIAGAAAGEHNANAALRADIERSARPRVIDRVESHVGQIVSSEVPQLLYGSTSNVGPADLKTSWLGPRPAWTQDEIGRFSQHMTKFVDGRAEIGAYLREKDRGADNQILGGGVAGRTLGEYPAYLVRVGFADKPSEFGAAIFDGPTGREDATRFAHDWERDLIARGVEKERNWLGIPSTWMNSAGGAGGISMLSHVQVVKVKQNAVAEGQPRGVAYWRGVAAPQSDGGKRWWPEDRKITTAPGGGMQVMLDPKTKDSGQLEVIETLPLPVTGNPQRTQSGEIDN